VIDEGVVERAFLQLGSKNLRECLVRRAWLIKISAIGEENRDR
jgi:hypothetical protein